MENFGIKNCLKSWHFSIDSKILFTSLSIYEKMLYLSLRSYLSPSGETCFPSVSRLAIQISCCKRTVFRALAELEEKKIVIRHEQFGDNGGQKTTLYEIHEIPEEFFLNPLIEPQSKKCDGGDAQSSGGGCQRVTGGMTTSHGGSVCEAHNHLPKEQVPNEEKTEKNTQSFGLSGEPPEQDGKDTPPVGRSAERTKTGQNDTKQDEKSAEAKQQSIPSHLKEVADYFLLKTRRDSLSESEIETLKALGEVHSPSRITREILAAAERFKRLGKSLALLRMDYLEESLKKQSPTKKNSQSNSDDRAGEKGKSPPSLFSVDDVLRAYKLGGEDIQDLPMLCETYRLSESDTRKLFELYGVDVAKIPNCEVVGFG